MDADDVLMAVLSSFEGLTGLELHQDSDTDDEAYRRFFAFLRGGPTKTRITSLLMALAKELSHARDAGMSSFSMMELAEHCLGEAMIFALELEKRIT